MGKSPFFMGKLTISMARGSMHRSWELMGFVAGKPATPTWVPGGNLEIMVP